MKAQSWFRRAERFVRSYTGGMGGRGFQQLFDRDAKMAYSVVTREHDRADEPEKGFWRLLYRVRILFLSLSYKLAPPRRLLFVVCIVLAVWAIFDVDVDVGATPKVRVAFLSLLSVAGLVFLLLLELADRVVVRDELEVARELQRELLPQQAPPLDGYEFMFSYRTANTIGGDYYDFVPVDNERLGIVVGDASGHGMAAGLVMAIANSALHLGFSESRDPAAVARMVNSALYRTGGPHAFMTLLCGVLDPPSGRIDFVCAGHPYPLLRRADGEVEEVGYGALPLGIRPELELALHHAEIHPGDIMVLFTDGVVETLDANGDTFGFERLHHVLATGGSARAVHDRVVEAVEAFCGGGPIYDDRSLVVVRREA